MQDSASKRNIIEAIRSEIEASKDTHIYRDYVNALKLISQVVFTRSSGFILEFIQNAEDAGLGLSSRGTFEIRINRTRVKIQHNGRPFTPDDVKALCGIRSSKKPERGTLGYLGIGFKSVFKVTDSPEIYSNGFLFKFDRNHGEWADPGSTPWHVIPLWLDEASEGMDPTRTTFIVPYRESAYYSALLEEVEKIRTELYLFLTWLSRIEVIDEASGQTSVLENVGEDEQGIATLRHGPKEQRFKFFRRVVDVPDWLRDDRLTQEYRAGVTRREIAIAFALDSEGNLSPEEAGAMYGGVYSFLPLGEARSGAKFPVQADFLVQPGRDAVNYEARWNRWLVESVADLCKEAVAHFKDHGKWKYQFLPCFEFTKAKGLESYEVLFGPRLIKPLEDFLRGDACVPTADNGWARVEQVVRLIEEKEAAEDLMTMGIVAENEVASVFGGDPDLKLAHPDVVEAPGAPIKKIDRFGLLGNQEFLKGKCQEGAAASWFRSLYLWLHKHQSLEPYVERVSGRRAFVAKRARTYHQFELILTSDGRLLKGGEVSLFDVFAAHPFIKDLAAMLEGSKAILHPDILAGASTDEERNQLRGFLTGLAGVQVLDAEAVCKEVLLPKILVKAPKPSPGDLVRYTQICQDILCEEPGDALEFWVLTKRDEIRAGKETLLPAEFRPEENWEVHQAYVSGLSFVSARYLTGAENDDELRIWRKFLKAGGVKDFPDQGVEEFAVSYAVEKLGTRYNNVRRVEKRNLGYDLEMEGPNGERLQVEVKGLRHDQDIELTGNETAAADRYKDAYLLAVVCSIPENAALYVIRNPALVGKKEKLTIPTPTWRGGRWS